WRKRSPSSAEEKVSIRCRIWSAARIAALVFFFIFLQKRKKEKKNGKAAILAALQIRRGELSCSGDIPSSSCSLGVLWRQRETGRSGSGPTGTARPPRRSSRGRRSPGPSGPFPPERVTASLSCP